MYVGPASRRAVWLVEVAVPDRTAGTQTHSVLRRNCSSSVTSSVVGRLLRSFRRPIRSMVVLSRGRRPDVHELGLPEITLPLQVTLL